MTLAFEATSVHCDAALGGEILQVTMDTLPDGKDDYERHTPYLLIGQNFEFSGPPTIEWHDGNDYNGGGMIVAVTLRRDGLSVQLDRERNLEVKFSLPDSHYAELRSFLKRIFFPSGVLAVH